MADYYVRAGASGAANGANWTDAYTAVEGGAEAVSGPGNRIFGADGHVETHVTAIVLDLAGSQSTGGVEMLSVNDTGDPTPPTALSPGAKIQTTGGASLTIRGDGRIKGWHFKAGSDSSSTFLAVGSSADCTVTLDDCVLEVGSTNTGSRIEIGSAFSTRSIYRLNNPSFVFAHAGQEIRVLDAAVEIHGGSVSGAALTMLFSPHTASNRVEVIGLDASACATTVVLFDGYINGHAGVAKLAECKLPSGWTKTLTSAALRPESRIELVNCTAGATLHRYMCDVFAGTIRDSITAGETRYLDGAQYDGGTRYSLKFAAAAIAQPTGARIVGPDMHGYAETAAASTATVQILHDGASALTDADCWLELFVSSQWISGERANPLAAGTAHTASGQTWTGASGTGPNGSATWNALKLTCGFTPSAAGPVMGRVVVAKASTTVYVDINLTLTVD